MTRQTHTPAERAQNALDIEQRRVDRLTAARDEHKGRMQHAEQELTAVVRRRDHLAQSPDLPQAPDPALRRVSGAMTS